MAINIPKPPIANDVIQEEQEKKKGLSPKTKFGLLIAGGVLSLALAAACVILLFIL